MKIVICIMLLASIVSAQSNEFRFKSTWTDFYLYLPLSIGTEKFGENLVDDLDPVTLEEIILLKRNDINWFDRTAAQNYSSKWDQCGNISRDILIYSLPLILMPGLLKHEWKDVLTVSAIYLETYYLTKGITSLAKGLAKRKRPYLYNTDLTPEERYNKSIEDGDGRVSFFSGHAANAFALATTMSVLFEEIYGKSGWSYLVWGGSMTVAALTAYSRVKSGEHYPSDVIIGAMAGAAISYFILSIHKSDSADKIDIQASANCIGFQIKL